MTSLEPTVRSAASVANAGLRWAGALGVELLRLPHTLHELRTAVASLGELPASVARLAAELDLATSTLDEHVPQLSDAVTGGIDRRVHELAGTVGAFATHLEQLVAVLDRAGPAIEQLPPQVDRLEGTVATLGRSVAVLTEQLGTVLPKLTDVVADQLSERVENLDRVVSDLSRTLTNVLQAIPGVRRNAKP